MKDDLTRIENPDDMTLDEVESIFRNTMNAYSKHERKMFIKRTIIQVILLLVLLLMLNTCL